MAKEIIFKGEPFKRDPRKTTAYRDSQLAIVLTEQNEYLTTSEERALHYRTVLAAIQWARKLDKEYAKARERYMAYMRFTNRVL